MTHNTSVAKRVGSRFKGISDIIAELKKVIWLSRREAAYLTVLVLIVSLAAGVFLGLVDYGFVGLVENVFLGK